jgi:hypothetical protein
VLFGAALGNFVAVFFTEAFLGSPEGPQVSAGVAPQDGGAVLSFQMLF